jgi:hypothetical protein
MPCQRLELICCKIKANCGKAIAAMNGCMALVGKREVEAAPGVIPVLGVTMFAGLCLDTKAKPAAPYLKAKAERRRREEPITTARERHTGKVDGHASIGREVVALLGIWLRREPLHKVLA